MRVLIIGASGFIGSAIAHALIGDGYEVVALGRDLDHGQRILPQAHWRFGDLRKMTTQQAWKDHLKGTDLVVNASGALQSGLRDDVAAVQVQAIAALGLAAEVAGVKHLIQISAAGAETNAGTDFMASKAEADAALIASTIACTIIRPGLVIGRNAFGGTELVRTAAGLPCFAPEIAETGPIQCIALADVVAAVQRAIEKPGELVGSFDLVEADAHSLGGIIAAHRDWLGFARAPWRLTVPAAILRPVTAIADMLGWLGWRSPLRSNAMAALAGGVTGDAAQARALLGREPASLAATLAAFGPAGKADRWHARLALVYPLALAALVALWLGSGLVGLARADSAAALLRPALPESLARACVIGGSVADLLMGLGIMWRPMLATALKGSIALSLGYLVGSIALTPGLWLDPLGPMLKVLPILALTLACLAMAEER